MKKFLMLQRRGSIFLASVVALLFTPVVYWIMDKSVPRAVVEIRVLNSPVTPGEDLRMVFIGEAFRNCPAMAQEELIDGNNIVWTVKERFGVIQREPGHFEAEVNVPTPKEAAPGPALYRSTVRYACNPYQKWFAPLIAHREQKFTFSGASDQGSMPVTRGLALSPSRTMAE